MDNLLTTKQKRLVMSIYEQLQYSNITLTLDEFTQQVCNKPFEALTHSDITKFISYKREADVSLLTENQLYLFHEIREYLKKVSDTNPTCIHTYPTPNTKSQFNRFLIDVQDKWDIFIPQFINTKTISYKIQYRTDDYILATQFHRNQSTNKMDVIVFKNIMVLDIDDPILFEKTLLLLQQENDTFWIYQTYKGYHIYNMSRTFSLHRFDTLQLMHKLNCDKWYISFTKLYGCVVRLSKKQERNEPFIEKFICQVNHFPIHPNIKKLVEIKNNMITKQEN